MFYYLVQDIKVRLFSSFYVLPLLKVNHVVHLLDIHLLAHLDAFQDQAYISFVWDVHRTLKMWLLYFFGLVFAS